MTVVAAACVAVVVHARTTIGWGSLGQALGALGVLLLLLALYNRRFHT
nr:hypothetical protein [Catenuloplanes japonicus]